MAGVGGLLVIAIDVPRLVLGRLMPMADSPPPLLRSRSAAGALRRTRLSSAAGPTMYFERCKAFVFVFPAIRCMIRQKDKSLPQIVDLLDLWTDFFEQIPLG